MWQDLKNLYHFLVAAGACIFYRYPARKLKVIGVTGTDGKTTTVHLIYHLLKSSGKKVSMISSVKAIIGEKEYDTGFHVTTPDPWEVQKYLRQVVDAGYEYLVLEVTSHALDQNRVAFCNFLVGVLTNVTHEHLDYHKTYGNYVATKAKLLKIAKTAVINQDDESYKIISSKLNPSTTLRIDGERSRTIKDQSLKLVTYGIETRADFTPQNFPFKTKLIGEFNKYNILAAVTACKILGIDAKDIRRGIESFEPPIGREEIVYKSNFSVMIDFAHTPNALEQILSSVRPGTKGRLIHVFGSAGERDCQKRPQMGGISAKYADIIVLTAEDPRSEDVNKIIDDIASGIQNNKRYLLRFPDRKEAIITAVKMAKKGDLVILTGKSHEKSMNYGYGEEPWSEYRAVKEALLKKNEKN